MESQAIKVERRTELGTKLSRKVREEDRLPGIIYGHGLEPVPITLPRHDLEVALEHGHHLLSISLEREEKPYLVKDVQYDPLGMKLLHIDLARVNLDERVTVNVAVVLKGTPKGQAEGGVLEQVLDEIEVECLASSIPDALKVNVNHLDVGDTLTIADLTLPEGVTVLNEPGDIVANVRVIAEEPEEAPTAEATATSEPQIITKGKAEEGEESES